mmetsp:Transcript_70521/g.181752  ORF Transcript_70521/g.181752 Transcript_70521/m.181752 type:complete len:470 (-) Transcript_70521:90-1499(-)
MRLGRCQRRERQVVAMRCRVREEDSLRPEAHRRVGPEEASALRHRLIAVEVLAEVQGRQGGPSGAVQVFAEELLDARYSPATANQLHFVDVRGGQLRYLQGIIDRLADRREDARAPILEGLTLHLLREVGVLVQRLHPELCLLVGTENVLHPHGLLLQLLESARGRQDALGQFGVLLLEGLQHALGHHKVNQVPPQLVAAAATEHLHGHRVLLAMLRPAVVHQAGLHVARAHVVVQHRGLVVRAIRAAQVQVQRALQRGRRGLVDELRPRQPGHLGSSEQRSPAQERRIRRDGEDGVRHRDAVNGFHGQTLGEAQQVASDLLHRVSLATKLEAQAAGVVHAQIVGVKPRRQPVELGADRAQLRGEEHRRLLHPARSARQRIIAECAHRVVEGDCGRRLALRVLVVHDLERLAGRDNAGLEVLPAKVNAQQEGGDRRRQQRRKGDNAQPTEQRHGCCRPRVSTCAAPLLT